MAREYYSLPEAAALLGISRIAVFKKVKKGQLPALRVGRNWAVPAAALAAAGGAPAAGVSPRPASRGRSRPAKPVQPPPPALPDAELDSMGWD
jgi:excisionase family DNA binding protein